MNYSTTVDFPSALAPGLIATIRKRSSEQRTKFNESCAKVLADIRDAGRKIAPLQDEAKECEDAAKLEPCSCNGHDHDAVTIENVNPELTAHLCRKCSCRNPKYRDGLIFELEDARSAYENFRRDKYYPALIKWAVKDVTATFEIDGMPVTMDNLFQLPDAVLDEIGEKIDSMFSLSVAEQLGFKSPGTSSAPEAGPTTTSDVQVAS